MSSYKKGRDWACVVYPESVNPDWLNILQESKLQIAISPLHDKDLNPDYTQKKSHWHVLIRYEGPTTHNHVKELCDSIGATNPIKIESARGMFRYHIHLDNPEKYQYSDRDRILLNGFNTDNLDSFTEAELDNLENDILDIIEEYNITEYYHLLNYLKVSEKFNLLKVAKKRTVLLNAYIKSRKGSLKKIITSVKSWIFFLTFLFLSLIILIKKA